MHPRRMDNHSRAVRLAVFPTAAPHSWTGGGKAVRDHGFPPAAAGSVHPGTLEGVAREGHAS